MASSTRQSLVLMEEEMARGVLDGFIGLPEQTYEDFLSTFTWLPNRCHRESCPGGVKVTGSLNIHCSSQLLLSEELGQESKNSKHRSDSLLKPCSSFETIPTNQRAEYLPDTGDLEDAEQLVLGEGDTVGCCHSLMGSGRVQVDNFLTSSDIDTDSDNEETMQDILLYPGETDTELPCEDGLIIRNTCLEMHCTPDLQPTAHEHHGDDIQPFSLDPDFDYGSVALTPKLSSLELDFLNDRTNQKAEEVHT